MLENGNTDSSQRNIIYIIDGEDAATIQAVAGTSILVGIAGTYKEIAEIHAPTLCYQSCSLYREAD